MGIDKVYLVEIKAGKIQGSADFIELKRDKSYEIHFDSKFGHYVISETDKIETM